jgi:hypothetical protein
MTTDVDADEPREDEPDRAPGRIITFYSYKGGTGRSMVLANLAWLLASSGQRVLAIDWDLEAPGLHRYLRPFLADPELAETPGLIDFFVDFVEAGHIEARSQSPATPPPEATPTATGTSEVATDAPKRAWFHDRAALDRYAVPVSYEFAKGSGRLDLVGAGQQGPSYGLRVNTFRWDEFYQQRGGGIFLEAVMEQLRARYDYVLIDSRTGLSDTSGICTVQMPDELVVCFTLNLQSMAGAGAAATSADLQRRMTTGEPSLKVWPVPMRVELAEKDRLEAARAGARDRFSRFLWHVPLRERTDYWGGVEILYYPYYAYEEVLATIADSPGQTASLLASIERLSGHVTGHGSMPRLERAERKQLLARYLSASRPVVPSATGATPKFFLSFSWADKSSTAIVARVSAALEERFGREVSFWTEKVPLGAVWEDALRTALDEATVVLVMLGPKWDDFETAKDEVLTTVHTAIAQKKSVIPVALVDDESAGVTWPEELQTRRGTFIRFDHIDEDLPPLIEQLAKAVPAGAAAEPPADVDDPHKGQFGGRSEQAGRRLSARVSEAARGWYDVALEVSAAGRTPLRGEVEFHLHPTFNPPVANVPVEGGRPATTLRARGAFTEGAVADDGATRLELNLADLTDAPQAFRLR